MSGKLTLDSMEKLLESKLLQFEEKLCERFQTKYDELKAGQEALNAGQEALLKAQHRKCCINNTGPDTNGNAVEPPRPKPEDPATVTKLVLIGDSITKDISPSGLAKLAGEPVTIRSTPGAIPSTVRGTDMAETTKAVLHAGTDCLTATECTADEETTQAVKIASEITAKLDELKSTTEQIYYWAIIKRTDIGDRNNCTVGLHCLIAETNNIVKEHCADKHYHFIDNNNVTEVDLYDGLHLNEEGVKKLVVNIGRAIQGQPSLNVDSGDQPFVKIKAKRYGCRPSGKKPRPRHTMLGDYFPHVKESQQPA